MMRAISIFFAVAVVAGAQPDPFLSGLEAFRRSDYVTAEREFTRSTEPRAKTFLALTLAATSRCQLAEPGLTSGFASPSPDISRLSGLALAQCRISSGNFEEAAAVLAKLRAASPDDADVLYLSARLEMRQWNETMYQLYRRAPGSFRVNQISGEVLETQGRFLEAVAEYRKAIAKSPNTIGLHYRLGRALLMTSHAPDVLDSALKEFQSESALNPHDAAAHYQIAQILITRGNAAQAAESLQRAMTIDPKFVEPLVALGKLRLEQTHHEEAISLFQRAIAVAPAHEGAHYNLMMAYRNAGRLEDARREKAALDKLQKSPEGEFSEFLKKLGGTAPKK